MYQIYYLLIKKIIKPFKTDEFEIEIDFNITGGIVSKDFEDPTIIVLQLSTIIPSKTLTQLDKLKEREVVFKKKII